MQRRRLGVNIDHVATLRQARGSRYPQPIAAALLAEAAGADQITVHLREDARHIQASDVHLLRQLCCTELNLEMAATPAMLAFACKVRPQRVTLVPEKRQELTTEGGLDVVSLQAVLPQYLQTLHTAHIVSSLFIDAEAAQISAAQQVGAHAIELHTGPYCEATTATARTQQHSRLACAAQQAQQLGLQVACGHGLHYHNVAPLVPIAAIEEYNIGHSIIAQAVLVGLSQAVRDMLQLLTVG